ncbi:MAG: IS110 family RNA-guided transposase [Planctomycetota bacterium]
MPGSNYSKQLIKRQRISRATLVAGMDIGNKFNAMVLMNKEGKILGRYPKVYNSRNGFDYFTKVIKAAMAKYKLKDVLIGMEPTGHYWRKIAFFAKEQGHEVRFVRTTALKHQRELDESSSAKNDLRDAHTIANITREGKYIDTVIEDGVLRQLRTLCHVPTSGVRERILRYHTGSQHALGAVLDDCFPELRELFWSMKAKGLWAILEKCPFPEDVLELGEKKLADIIARASRRQATAAQKAKTVYQAAKVSVGLSKIGMADRYRLKMYLAEVKRSDTQLKELEGELKQLLNQVPVAEYILSIPGIGALSAAAFLGELGDPAHFKHPSQIVKYAGYDPQEHDSGQRTARRRISKKGRWLLRKYLFFMSLGVVRSSRFFKEYYLRKLEGKNRFGQVLGKKEALCAVVIKLIKVIFALLRDQREFTAEAPARLAQAA